MESHPLAENYRPMTEAEFEVLTESIRANGCRNDIWTFEGKILDGRHRFRACQIVGIEPKLKEFKGTYEEAHEFAEIQNGDRRHDAPKTPAIRKSRVAELRAKGMSTRQIADELKIHKTQVLRDLDTVCPPEPDATVSLPEPKESEPQPADEPPLLNDERLREKPKQTTQAAAKPVAPAKPPEKITGRDGKQYPATKPTPARKPEPKEQPKPKCAWADVATQLAQVANVIESMGAIKDDPSEPWKLVESLEAAGRSLLKRATELRKRHGL